MFDTSTLLWVEMAQHEYAINLAVVVICYQLVVGIDSSASALSIVL